MKHLILIVISLISLESFSNEYPLHAIYACYQYLHFLNIDNSTTSSKNNMLPGTFWGTRNGKKGIYLFDHSQVVFCSTKDQLQNIENASVNIEKYFKNTPQLQVQIPLNKNAIGSLLRRSTEVTQVKSISFSDCEPAKNSETTTSFTEYLNNEAEQTYEKYKKQLQISKKSTASPDEYASMLARCYAITDKLDKTIKTEVKKFPLSNAFKKASENKDVR